MNLFNVALEDKMNILKNFNFKELKTLDLRCNRILNININTLRDRLRRGGTIEDAFTRSVAKTGGWQK